MAAILEISYLDIEIIPDLLKHIIIHAEYHLAAIKCNKMQPKAFFWVYNWFLMVSAAILGMAHGIFVKKIPTLIFLDSYRPLNVNPLKVCF